MTLDWAFLTAYSLIQIAKSFSKTWHIICCSRFLKLAGDELLPRSKRSTGGFLELSTSTGYETYRLVVFNNRPVLFQRKFDADHLEVVFYDNPAAPEIIHENDWKSFSKNVFVPKTLGPRKRVAHNWGKYSKYCT